MYDKNTQQANTVRKDSHSAHLKWKTIDTNTKVWTPCFSYVAMIVFNEVLGSYHICLAYI